MASAEYSVLTPERVSLQYDIAGIGSRGAAAFVDSVIQVVTLMIIFLSLSAATAAGLAVLPSGGAGATALVLGLLALGTLVIVFGYCMVFEIMWNGQTPGKRLLSLRVIRENGYPMRPVDAVIRNLVRIVDWLPASYAIGLVVMLLNNRAKRLGDFAAGTIVVREGLSSGAGTMLIPKAPEAQAITLSHADAMLVRDFLTRRGAMDPTARARLAHRLANALARRYHLGFESDPELFLEQLGA